MNVKPFIKPLAWVIGALVVIAVATSLGGSLLQKDPAGMPVWLLYLWIQGESLVDKLSGPFAVMAILGTIATIITTIIPDTEWSDEKQRNTMRLLPRLFCAVGIVGYIALQTAPTTNTINFIHERLRTGTHGEYKLSKK